MGIDFGRTVTRRAAVAMAVGGGVLMGQTRPAIQRELPPEVSDTFSSSARQKLLSEISAPGFRGRLGPPAVTELMRLERKSVAALMLDLLPLARSFSNPSLSNYRVGAVVQGSPDGLGGSLYLGANIEVPDNGLGQTVHAEQAALANAYMWGESRVLGIAVTAAPCGHCRQFLNELSLEGEINVLVQGAAPTKLSALLPMAFGPKDLGMKRGAMPPDWTPLTLTAEVDLQQDDVLLTLALERAHKSYAPYTSSYSGIVLSTRDQLYFGGSYIENAAFNPSLAPLQCALAAVYAQGAKPTEIVRAVLVELEGAKISQAASTRATLSALAPAARLDVVLAKQLP